MTLMIIETKIMRPILIAISIMVKTAVMTLIPIIVKGYSNFYYFRVLFQKEILCIIPGSSFTEFFYFRNIINTNLLRVPI